MHCITVAFYDLHLHNFANAIYYSGSHKMKFTTHAYKHRSAVSEEEPSRQFMLITNSFVVTSVYLNQNKVGTCGINRWHHSLTHIVHNKLVKHE